MLKALWIRGLRQVGSPKYAPRKFTLYRFQLIYKTYGNGLDARQHISERLSNRSGGGYGIQIHNVRSPPAASHATADASPEEARAGDPDPDDQFKLESTLRRIREKVETRQQEPTRPRRLSAADAG
uniref:Uncharacterized protein n=1 Tax=Pristionchus pacificus TaxID=54126 RepID=A0A2A6CVG5_PRIPA|eukprot:PDM82175.1 hypothetical protein PRIPAC_36568 [Pristionchus pacificus]